jgi:phosphoribosylglycinamide formyltransferase 1
MKTKVKTALIASGSGTDAYAIMDAYKSGQIPNIDLAVLISTKSGAGCLEKAKECGIAALTISREELGGYGFNHELLHTLINKEIKMVFLVGCIVKIRVIPDITFYNIHPADIETCGGKGMYGLEPHKKVLSDVADLVRRGRKNADDKFYTQPTIHQVTDQYDDGDYFMKLNIEIPNELIVNFIKNNELEESASQLQKHVLQYEWLMLPPAVKMAAAKILEK